MIDVGLKETVTQGLTNGAAAHPQLRLHILLRRSYHGQRWQQWKGANVGELRPPEVAREVRRHRAASVVVVHPANVFIILFIF